MISNVHQVDTEEVHVIENQKFVPYHFLTTGKEQISITFDAGESWTWSGGLEITTLGETYLKLTNTKDNIEYFVRVDISMQNNSIFSVQFNPKKLGIFPYRIENQTRQVGDVIMTSGVILTPVSVSRYGRRRTIRRPKSLTLATMSIMLGTNLPSPDSCNYNSMTSTSHSKCHSTG